MKGSSSSQDGIDIRQALEILSERTPHAHGECTHAPTKEAQSWGQRIDLERKQEDEKKQEESPTEAMKEERKKLDEERTERLAEIKTKFGTLSPKELLEIVLDSQQQRVATYREYDSGLEELLKTKNMTNYPMVCAAATASFSVVSETINGARDALKGRSELVSLISRLQKAEKDKLGLTAALHLEKIRSASHVEEERIDETGQAASRISDLLKDGVASLQEKIATGVEEINEVLEELRFALAEEEGDSDD